MSEGDATHDARLTQLRLLFLERTTEELPQFSALLESLAKDDANAAQQLLMLTHRTHGSGAMLGFLSIGAAAGRMERLLREVEGRSVSAGQLRELAQLMQELANALQSARQSAAQ